MVTLNHILTAAHCRYERYANSSIVPFQQFIVRLGEFSIGIKDDLAEDFGVLSFETHPLYSSLSVYHDIAIIELRRRVVYIFVFRIILLDK